MKHIHSFQFLIVLLAMSALLLAGCSPKQEAPVEEAPVQVEHLTGAEQPTRVKVTEEAAKRLDLKTDSVQIENAGGVDQTVIPYASIIYDTEGHTWVYTSTDALTYVRTAVEVQSISGDDAIIKAGLPAGTEVVTVGAEELYGSETEFEEE